MASRCLILDALWGHRVHLLLWCVDEVRGWVRSLTPPSRAFISSEKNSSRFAVDPFLWRIMVLASKLFVISSQLSASQSTILTKVTGFFMAFICNLWTLLMSECLCNPFHPSLPCSIKLFSLTWCCNPRIPPLLHLRPPSSHLHRKILWINDSPVTILWVVMICSQTTMVVVVVVVAEGVVADVVNNANHIAKYVVASTTPTSAPCIWVVLLLLWLI